MALDTNPFDLEHAERALERSPVGGGTSVSPRWTREDADVVVSETAEFERADRHDIVYIADGETVEVTDEPFDLSDTVVIGGRHKPGVDAGLIDVRTSGPDSAAYRGALRASGQPGHIEGVRIQGPSWYPDRADRYTEIDETDVRCWPGYEHIEKEDTTRSERDDMRTAAFARGVNLRNGGSVRNCDIHGFTHANVSIGSSNDAPDDVQITRNKLHNACMPGLGYPINLYHGTLISEYNFFNAYRHSITGFGHSGSGYVTRRDVHGPDAMLTPVDFHCLEENGGGGLIAGSYLHAEESTFLAYERYSTPGWYSRSGCPAIGIRGRPADGGEGYTTRNCHFVHDSESDALDQRNVPFPTGWSRSGNEYGEEQWTADAGAPVDWSGGTAPVAQDRGALAARRRARGRAISEHLGDLEAALS